MGAPESIIQVRMGVLTIMVVAYVETDSTSFTRLKMLISIE
jgi:hypothetical protein